MSAPNLKEIEWAIYDLQHSESSTNKYIILAALYTCRDHLLRDTQQEPRIAAYLDDSAPTEQMAQYGDSDFLRAAAGKDPANAWSVMDELMETLKVIRPKVYDSVMAKLDRL